MIVQVQNTQRGVHVNVRRMARLARCAIRRLRIRADGVLSIAFVNARHMRQLNQQFLRHDRSTDVLSFRYDGERVVGEIVIAPSEARRYAREHGLSCDAELSRYVVHGILHWLGHEDRTPAQQRRMRQLEDQLLSQCP